MHNQANFQFCQFFVVLHKIRHECIMTLHGHFTKITKKTKHGNVCNDRLTEKNNSQKHDFGRLRGRYISFRALFS